MLSKLDCAETVTPATLFSYSSYTDYSIYMKLSLSEEYMDTPANIK